MLTKTICARAICLIVFSLTYSTAVLADFINIDNTRLTTLLDDQTLIIDIRRAEEWRETGVIEGSQLLTFFDKNRNFDADKWLADIAGFSDKETPVILVCRSGSRSGVIANWMVNTLGYKTVYNVEQGIIGWKRDAKETIAP